MEQILELLKQFDMFTPKQIIFIFTFIIILASFAFKFLSSENGKKMLGIDVITSKEIKDKLIKIETTLDCSKNDIETKLKDFSNDVKEIKDKLSSVKTFIENEFKTIEAYIKEDIKNDSIHYNNIKDIMIRTHGIVIKIADKIEKTDDLLKKLEPESKLSFRELEKDIDEIKNEIRRLDQFLILRMSSSVPNLK